MTDPKPKMSASARGMWLALGFVLSIFLVPYFLGLSLPDDYQGAVTAELAHAPQEVWDELFDHRLHPLSGGSVVKLVELPSDDLGPAWEERMQRTNLVVSTKLAEPPQRLIRLAIDASNGVESTWEYELGATDGGTQLVIRQRVRITDPGFSTPYFRTFFHYLGFAQQAPRDQVQSIARGLGEDEPEILPLEEE